MDSPRPGLERVSVEEAPLPAQQPQTPAADPSVGVLFVCFFVLFLPFEWGQLSDIKVGSRDRMSLVPHTGETVDKKITKSSGDGIMLNVRIKDCHLPGQ